MTYFVISIKFISILSLISGVEKMEKTRGTSHLSQWFSQNESLGQEKYFRYTIWGRGAGRNLKKMNLKTSLSEAQIGKYYAYKYNNIYSMTKSDKEDQRSDNGVSERGLGQLTKEIQ